VTIWWPTAAVGATSRNRTSRTGQVLVLFAIGIFVLLGVVGLGLDGSRTFEERRAAQTAVDHAATAAAFASCTGSNVATSQAAGQTAATRNGFDNAAAAITVTVDPVVGQANTSCTEEAPANRERVWSFPDLTC
jgi:Flp pilus assembly protein TadG